MEEGAGKPGSSGGAAFVSPEEGGGGRRGAGAAGTETKGRAAGPPGCVPGPLGLPLGPAGSAPLPARSPAVWTRLQTRLLEGPSPRGLSSGWPGPGPPSPASLGAPCWGFSRLRRGSGDRQNATHPQTTPPQLRPSSGDSANQPGSQMGAGRTWGGSRPWGPPRGGEAESFQSGRLACGAAGPKASASPPLPLLFAAQ